MVPVSLRINRADFPTLLKAGKRHHGVCVTAVYAPSTTAKVSVVVSKKVAKQAVDRNRLRRRVYGAVERFLKTSPFTGAVIFLVKHEAAKSSREALATDVTRLLAQITKSR